MISGTTFLLATLLSAATPASPPDIPPDAAALVGRLKRPAPADTAYTEVRFLKMFRQPLVLRGALHYGGPGELGKRVDAPYRETTSISGGDVDVVREGRAPRHFSLSQAPELSALLASFSALLGGDAALLAQNYRVKLQDGAAWRLTLTPRAAGLASHLRDIVVDGAGAEPRCFALHEADGDASVLLLGPLANAKLPENAAPGDIAALCSSPP